MAVSSAPEGDGKHERGRVTPFGVERTTDPRVVYLDQNVLEAARERVRHVLRTFDHVWVSFSGGKDSLAVLWLVREVMDEMGMQSKPVNAVFRDEELIPDDVINFIAELRNDPRFNIQWYCIPMKNQMFIMGAHYPYVQWDPAREHVRPMPEFAIKQLHPQGLPLRQTELSALTFQQLGIKGRIAVLNGIRADESRMRRLSCLARRNKENYICADPSGARGIFFIKPIYDWSENDIFRFFFDRGIKYCAIYDTQTFAMQPLRVSTPLHDQAYGMLRKLRTTYPKFYEQIVTVFPQVATHERYWKEVDQLGVIHKYPKSFTGIVQYIHENISSPRAKKAALAAVKRAMIGKQNNKRLNVFADKERGPCYGYPLLYVFKLVVTGTYTDGIQVKGDPSPAEIAYEHAAAEEQYIDGAEEACG
jgi:predicted phosphoadenosine phosphosulfate sulfurtransferase